MPVEKGDRVGVIVGTNGDTIDVFGFGVYEGRAVPHTDDVTVFGMSLRAEGIESPCIRLDSGELVYGCECWWGPEDRVRKMLENKKTAAIKPADYRTKAKIRIK